MTRNADLRRAIRYALYANAAAAAVGLPAVAEAQVQPAAAAPAPVPLQEVVVTGSRISEPGLQSISPVTTISSQDIKSEGLTRIEDVLNNMPQVMADQGSMSSNGATGTANVDLRGLGPQRTLVLINGRRLMPGNPDNTSVATAPDLNNIPAALVSRVDILTGGASAVYGADAVAGVVNFVMNDHFQGFRIDANADMYNHEQHSAFGGAAPRHGYGSAPSTVDDGKTKDITFILGGNFADGKGNATAYLGYRRVDALLQSQRDFSRCTLSGNNCSGSSTAATGRFFSTNGVFFSPTLTVDQATGQFIPWVSARDAFNYGALNYYQRPDERWSGGAFAHYDVTEHNQVYSEFMFMSDHTIAQIAPSGAFIGSGTGRNPVTGQPDGAWTVNCNNPLLSAQEATTLCGAAAGTATTAEVLFGRRNVEGGNRQDDLTHTSYRLVIGTRGDFADIFNYDVYGQEGYTLRTEEYLNDVSRAKLTNALQAVGTLANPVCLSGATGCVPYNIWGTGPLDPRSVAYFTTPGFIEGNTEERIFSGNITGDFSKYVKLPSATTGLVVNVGAEYRAEFMVLRPDVEFQGDGTLADLAGQGSATLPLNAALSVREGFLEARLPLVQDAAFAKELSFETGYRYSSYDVGFNTNTYKFGLDWSPVSDLRLRASYNRAVRAPNISELFAEKFVALDGSVDPCAGSSTSSPATATSAQCQRSGLSLAQYGAFGTPANPAGQYNGKIGGNPLLKPEVADTYTFGLVITPTALPSFNMTLDYFDIKINDIIGTYGGNLIINQCVFNNNPQFCSLVHRDASGSLWFSPSGYVIDNTLNLGYLWTRGVDVGVHYRQEIGTFGHMDFSLAGTYTASSINEPYPGSGAYDCAGYFGGTCGNPLPKWRHVFRDTWATPWQGFDVSLQWRHLNSVKIDSANPSPLLAGAFSPAIETIGSRDYLDLVFDYQVAKGITVRLGANNVLDKDPPILPTTDLAPPFFNGNTYPQVYDTLGRYVFLNLTMDF